MLVRLFNDKLQAFDNGQPTGRLSEELIANNPNEPLLCIDKVANLKKQLEERAATPYVFIYDEIFSFTHLPSAAFTTRQLDDDASGKDFVFKEQLTNHFWQVLDFFEQVVAKYPHTPFFFFVNQRKSLQTTKKQSILYLSFDGVRQFIAAYYKNKSQQEHIGTSNDITSLDDLIKKAAKIIDDGKVVPFKNTFPNVYWNTPSIKNDMLKHFIRGVKTTYDVGLSTLKRQAIYSYKPLRGNISLNVYYHHGLHNLLNKPQDFIQQHEGYDGKEGDLKIVRKQIKGASNIYEVLKNGSLAITVIGNRFIPKQSTIEKIRTACDDYNIAFYMVNMGTRYAAQDTVTQAHIQHLQKEGTLPKEEQTRLIAALKRGELYEAMPSYVVRELPKPIVLTTV